MLAEARGGAPTPATQHAAIVQGVHVALWIAEVEGGFSLKWKAFHNTDRVTITIDSRVLCILLLNRNLAEVLRALIVLGALFWIVKSLMG